VEKVDLTGNKSCGRGVPLYPDQFDVEPFALEEPGVLRHPQRQDSPSDKTIADAKLVGAMANRCEQNN
jgi:hypothetical protein